MFDKIDKSSRALRRFSSIVHTEVSSRFVWFGILTALLVNLGILLWYQTKLGGDFPFQDEWGYVDRLVHLKSVGLFHYLFDVYQVYFMPGTLAIWYLFYHFFHLDIMAIRYSGAAITTGVAFLVCVNVIGHRMRFDVRNLMLISIIPFIICSLNHWATYNQSIESLIEPLLFGCVFVACWAGQKMTYKDGDKWQNLLWLMTIVACSLVAVSIYAPGLSILIAIAIARILLYRRIDIFSISLALIGLGIGFLYLSLGGGSGHHIQFSEVHIISVINEWIILFGNALLTNPVGSAPRWCLGILMISIMVVSTLRCLFLSSDRRLTCFVPLVLSIYTFGVSLEIAWAYHSPDFGQAPRYAIHMMGGPIAVVLWAILLPQTIRLRFYASVASVVVLVCTLATIIPASIMLPYAHANFDKIRAELLMIYAPITDEQQKEIQVGTPLKEMVYPDLQFLREKNLALYRKTKNHVE